MKKLFAFFLIINGSLSAQLDYHIIASKAQEKVSIVLKQMHASYNWLDNAYATRERYYLSSISLDYIRQLKDLSVGNQASYSLIQKLEMIVEQLHVLDLDQKEFERIQCAAQELIKPVMISRKMILT